MPGKVDKIPNVFKCHPFRYIDHKEEASIRKRAVGRESEQMTEAGQRFYMDFGFLRALTADYKLPVTKTDRIVTSFDRLQSYLLIVDEHTQHVWVFLTKPKDPPVDTVKDFLKRFGQDDGGMVMCDQGGELTWSERFRTDLQHNQGYIVEPTGADDPSHNGGAESWNGTFAVTVQALLYGAGLSAVYWSAALVHAVLLHNRWVHLVTQRTPYEAWYRSRPNIKRLRMFGARVCVKHSGKRQAKLDKHRFKGIFIGYSTTIANVRYLDLQSGLEKTCGHTAFDEV